MKYLPEDNTPARNNPGLYWQLKMFCPECGNEVEQWGPWGEAWSDAAGQHAPVPDKPADTGDHTAVTVHPDRDDYDSPIGTRGGFTQIDLTCPAGHKFALIIANHKGSQFIAAVRRPLPPPPSATPRPPSTPRRRLPRPGERADGARQNKEAESTER